MIEYIYFVKCPNCEDEPFSFFEEAKEFALGCLSQKPIITQIEVDRNDFGECRNSADLGTVWSWEDMMKDTEPNGMVFSKDETFGISEGLDDFDRVEAAAQCSRNCYDFYNAVATKVSVKEIKPYAKAAAKFVKDNYGLTGDEAEELLWSGYTVWKQLNESCKKDRKPIPEGMTLKELVEEMEEREDTVECAGCEELFDKADCVYKDGIGWLCSDCEDTVVKCTWCEELFDRSECRYEVDMGWLCSRCEAAIKSRGETLTFRENNYWDFLDESIDPTTKELEEASLTGIADAINAEYGSSYNERSLLDRLGTNDTFGAILDNGHTDEPKQQNSQSHSDFSDREKAKAERLANKYAAENKFVEFNKKYCFDILHRAEWPALDETTGALIYDEASKKAIAQVYINEREASALNTKRTYAQRTKWLCKWVVNGKQYTSISAAGDTKDEVHQNLLNRIKSAQQEAINFGERFDWDGTVLITEYKAPEKTASVADELNMNFDKSKLTLCPECGTNSFDVETGFCMNCGFN